MGRRTLFRTLESIGSFTEWDGDCRVWTRSVDGRGYPQGRFGSSRSAKVERMHRVVFELAVRPLVPGEYVLHRCDVRRCLRPDHLFAGDHAANMADMAAKGRGRKSRKAG
jgi:hypothetical protein